MSRERAAGMMEGIALSVNPTYYCNFRCDFCYLSREQLGSSSRLPLEDLTQRLLDVSSQRRIEHIDLYGGEVGLLPQAYFRALKDISRVFCAQPLNVITNLSVINEAFLDPDVELSVSWDYTAREKHRIVYENIRRLNPRPIHVLVLASRRLIDLDDASLDAFIDALNALDNVETVEIKPYSLNRHNPQSVSHREHERWLMRWFQRSARFRFAFVNERNVQATLAKEKSSWSDDHLYITPRGKFAVLEFDVQGNEFFLELNGLDDYLRWCETEKRKVRENSFCGSCEYLGHCLSEHLQSVRDLDASCNGHRGLLDWYRNERLQSHTASV